MFIEALIIFSVGLTDSTSKKSTLLNEVVVTANRSEQQIFNLANSINVLSKKDLKTSAFRTAPEALFGVNGVMVQKTNHGGGSPFVRGLTGNQTLLLIDGIRLNNSTFRYGPNQYLNTIDPFSIDKIEVLKGGGSVQYGSDAIGGTIQIFTAEPEFGSKFKANVLSRLATHGMEKTGRAELGFGNDKLAIGGSFNFRNFGDLVGGKNTGRQSPSGYDEQAGNIKAKFKMGKGVLTAAHQYFQANNVPVYHKVVLENFAINEFEPQRRNLTYLKFLQENDSKLFSNISIIASLQSTYEGRVSQKNGNITKTHETDKVFSKGFSTNIHSQLSQKYSANSGVEIYQDLVRSNKVNTNTITNESSKILRGLYPDKATFFNYSVYSMHQLIQKRWQFSAGLRYNGYSIAIPDETLGKSILSPKALVGNASILFNLSKSANIYVSYNTGFRAPNIDDLGTLGIVDFRYELPSNDLKPEKSDNYELGYKLKTNQFSSTISAFYNKLNNLITRVKVPDQVINGYNVYKKENVEEAYIKGAEWEFEAILSQKLNAFGGVAYLYGQNVTKNEPMRRMPPLHGRLGLIFQQKNFFFKPEFFYATKQTRLAQGDKDDNRIGKNGTDAWQIININSGYNFKFISVNICLQNLTNQDYRTHGSGINGVGRSALGTVQLHF
ncbi:MAG: TonB-dependent receptor [Bacteroidota bacterium]